jgi:FkbM family methyltransferase
VASDPRKLKPSELCRLLNSTPMGEVLSDRQLHRHRMRAGNRIGDGKHVDLLRYIAWLVQEKHAPRKESDGDPYERMKENARARNAAMALAGRDIGELPAIVDPDRKARAKTDFRFFCEAYFPQTFHLPWSDDHLKVISRIEQAVLRGGLFSMAMPRGSGKTSVCECACIWAVLNGHREFVCLIGSDEGHACDMLESIKTELDGNDLLLADYPEVVFPIQALDGIANRCNGQLYKGERTHIGWTAKEVVLPTIDGSPASGAIIKVAGITGRIRGMKYKRSDGKTARPTLVVIDDPQTDESARSLSQCATRESILAGAILGLAGPGKKISGIMPCTVIRPGDMADNILSRDRHPEWNGERTKMVYSFPSNEKLWQRYSEIRAESLRSQGDIELATAFYESNREEMDLGAMVAWPERFNYDERSAIQHAMNLKLQDEAAFFAEYQNEPLPEMAHHYWPNARIVAVEPHPQSFELLTKNTSHIPDSQLLRINAAISPKPGKCLLSFPVSNSRVADYVPDVWESLEPRYRDFGIEVPSLTVEQFWSQVTDFGIDEVDLIKLDCEGAEYLIIAELSALGLMDRIGWIRGEWHSRKDNLLLANLLSQTHVFNIDPNYPHSVGMFVAHRI